MADAPGIWSAPRCTLCGDLRTEHIREGRFWLCRDESGDTFSEPVASPPIPTPVPLPASIPASGLKAEPCSHCGQTTEIVALMDLSAACVECGHTRLAHHDYRLHCLWFDEKGGEPTKFCTCVKFRASPSSVLDIPDTPERTPAPTVESEAMCECGATRGEHSASSSEACPTYSYAEGMKFHPTSRFRAAERTTEGATPPRQFALPYTVPSGKTLTVERVAGSFVVGHLSDEDVTPDALRAEAMLRRHASMYDWSKREAAAINDYILTVRHGIGEELSADKTPAAPNAESPETPARCLLCDASVPFTIGGVCKSCDGTDAEIEGKIRARLDSLQQQLADAVLTARYESDAARQAEAARQQAESLARQAGEARDQAEAKLAALRVDAENSPFRPHMRARLIRQLTRDIDREAEMFKPGRMHHNGPRRIEVTMDIQDAKALRDELAARSHHPREDT